MVIAKYVDAKDIIYLTFLGSKVLKYQHFTEM